MCIAACMRVSCADNIRLRAAPTGNEFGITGPGLLSLKESKMPAQGFHVRRLRGKGAAVSLMGFSSPRVSRRHGCGGTFATGRKEAAESHTHSAQRMTGY